jgi:hypothetical protein
MNIFYIFLKSNLVFAMFIKILLKILEKTTLFGNESTGIQYLNCSFIKTFWENSESFGSFLM